MNEPPKPILHPQCVVCGWRKGGVDSWNGFSCKCGEMAPAIVQLAPSLKLRED